jgi:hypothetical protein
MTEQELQTCISFFKCVANEDRLKIVGMLAAGDRSVEQLSVQLYLKEHKILHHLARLSDLNLVQSYAEGKTRRYRLNRETLWQLNKEGFASDRKAESPEHEHYDAWARKVLSTYVDNEQLRAIPVTRKKRDVILDWLINKFERGKKYSEKEVNAIIVRHHPDIATLRREFIINKLMKREDAGGAYWRL